MMKLTPPYPPRGRLELTWYDPDAGWGLAVLWMRDRFQGRTLCEWGFRRVAP